MKDCTFISIMFYFVRVGPSFQPVKISLSLDTVPRDSVGVSPGGCCPYNPNHSFLGAGGDEWVRREGWVSLLRLGGRLTKVFVVSLLSYNLSALCPLPSPAWFIRLLGDIAKKAAEREGAPGREWGIKTAAAVQLRGSLGLFLLILSTSGSTKVGWLGLFIHLYLDGDICGPCPGGSGWTMSTLRLGSLGVTADFMCQLV